MDLKSSGARRAIAAFGIFWNVGIVTLVILSDAPFLVKTGFLLYGGWALVNLMLYGPERTTLRPVGSGRTSASSPRPDSSRSASSSSGPDVTRHVRLDQLRIRLPQSSRLGRPTADRAISCLSGAGR